MISEEQKEKAKEILIFLESKVVKKDERYQVVGFKPTDENIFNLIYELDGLVNEMYDESEEECNQ